MLLTIFVHAEVFTNIYVYLNQDRVDHLGIMVGLVHLDVTGHLVLMVSLETPVIEAHLDNQDNLGDREILVNRVVQAPLDKLVQEVIRVTPDQ